MIRARFHVNADDHRPVNWPIKHPYWITGYGDGYAVVVAYADNAREILRNWPDAHEIDADAVDGYTFTDRFPRPVWFHGEPPMTNPADSLPVVAYRVNTMEGHDCQPHWWYDNDAAKLTAFTVELLVRKSDAEAALRARDAEVEKANALLQRVATLLRWWRTELPETLENDLAAHLAASNQQEKPHG